MVGTLCFAFIAICSLLCFDESTLKEKYFVYCHFLSYISDTITVSYKDGGKTTAQARLKEAVSYSKSRKVVRCVDFFVSFLFPFFLTYI